MTLDARSRFKASPHAKMWADAVATDWFQEGLLAAIAGLSLRRASATDMANAAAEQFRMEGVRALMNEMLNLTEPDAPSKPPGLPTNLKPIK